MTEPSTVTPETAETGDQGGEGVQQSAAYTPPATQADLDRIITERVNRTKAQFKDYADLKTKAAELDQIKATNQTEAERQAEELTRWQGEAETWRGHAVGSRIQALAAGMFADPSDAVETLKSGQYLDAGGQIDDTAIQADLDALLERKPHWRRPDGTPAAPRVPAPNPAQGSGGGTPAADPATEFASILRQGLARS